MRKSHQEVVIAILIAVIVVFSGISIAMAIIDIASMDWVFPFAIAFFFFIIVCAIINLREEDNGDMDYYYSYHDYEQEKKVGEEKAKDEKKVVIVTEKICSSCGAPLKGDTCEYCGTKAKILKVIEGVYREFWHDF